VVADASGGGAVESEGGVGGGVGGGVDQWSWWTPGGAEEEEAWESGGGEKSTQASIDSLSGDTKESGEKNEAKQEKTEDESDESLGAAPVTISTEKTAAQLEDEKESEKDTNNEKKVIKGMHMKEKDETGPEIDGLKDKYAELVAHNSRLVEILRTTLELQTDLFSRILRYLFN